MTPVDATITSLGSQPTTCAVSRANSSAFAAPTAPVATFEFFERITTDRALPSARCSRLMVTLGPENRLFVKTPDAVVPSGAERIITSLVRSLIPMLPVCEPNPVGKSTSGTTLPDSLCQGATSPESRSAVSPERKPCGAVTRCDTRRSEHRRCNGRCTQTAVTRVAMYL